MVGLSLRFLFLLILTLTGRICTAAAQWPLAPPDGLTYRYPQPRRLVAFGDIHGDLVALIALLQHRHIIDSNLNWIGGDATVLSLGDLVDRGPNSRQVMELLMKLEGQAVAAGGRLIALLGNHEALVTQGDFRYVSLEDTFNIGTESIYEGDHKIARWIASRPTAVIFGDRLFVHAGLEDWILDADLDALNATVRAWFRYYQGLGEKPAPGTQWVLDEHGPLWTRRLAERKIRPDELSKWMAKIGVNQVVVGHSPTTSSRPELSYAGRVLKLDTAMSIAYGGQISSVTLISNSQIRGHLIPRPSDCSDDLMNSPPRSKSE